MQEIVSALRSSEIDYGIADEPFAKSARMRLHKAVQADFNFRKLNRDEYPVVDEEYAVAVNAREDKLLHYINEIIAEMGDKGLERLYSESVQEYRNSLSSDVSGDKWMLADARTSNGDDFRASCK